MRLTLSRLFRDDAARPDAVASLMVDIRGLEAIGWVLSLFKPRRPDGTPWGYQAVVAEMLSPCDPATPALRAQRMDLAS